MSDIKDLHKLFQQFEAGTLETSADKVSELHNRSIYLYGAGNIGKRLYQNFKSNGIIVEGFIDRNPDITLPDISVPVYQPTAPELQTIKESGTVIISGVFSISVCNSIKSTLSELGYQNVFALHEVNFSEVNNGSFYENLFDNSYNKVDVLGIDKKKIEKAFMLFHEKRDRAYYLEYLKAHLTMDFVRLPEPNDMNLQYLAHDIDYKKDYSRLIDCGGYDGDTYRELTENGCGIEYLAAFEPQIELYKKYANSIQTMPANLKSAMLFPCGVHSETIQLRFSNCADAKSTGKIDLTGDELVQCVKLDEALFGFGPTFIKMDIEGAETDALKGAENLIKENAPQLAICVYHSLSDLWEIPNIISNIRDDYLYYLRSYNYMGLETVLYAFPKNK